MSFWIASVTGLVVAYLLGSIPTGYLAGRLLANIDIRTHGSGSSGATNVLRTLGPWPASAVLCIDVLKGGAAIVLASLLLGVIQPSPDLPVLLPWVICLAGLAVLLGHSRSVWLGFSGGKSAATGLGVLLVMSWPVGLGAMIAFGLTLAVFRIVSLASMIAAGTAAILVCMLDQAFAYRLLVLAGAAYVVFLHRANIGRLLAGAEPRLGQGSPVRKTGL